MGKTGKLLIALAAVVVIAGGAVLLFGNKSNNNDTNGDSTNTPSTNNSAAGSSELSESEIAATITYTNDGFSPSSVNVPSGSALRIVNNSDDTVQPSSDPHPEHTNNPELNFGEIEPGQSTTMVVTKKGTWGMHNHFNEDHHATVTVQ